MPQNPPGFTFASGNARKIAALPGYALGGIATLLVRRNANLWVFGCGSGIGEGALELYRHVREVSPRTRLVWLAKNDDELADAAALGIPAVLKLSFRGFRATLRAGVVVVTHGLGDANRYATRGSFLVQLWHGIPFKRINLDSVRTTSNAVLPGSRVVRALLSRMHRAAASTISLVPAASEISASRLRTAFGLPAARVVVTGDPRDDVLVRGTEIERTVRARGILFSALETEDTGRRVVLYAPTWRDGDPDPGIPSPAEWSRIEAWLAAADSTLVVRPHPLAVGDYAGAVAGRPNVHLLTARARGDVTPILAAVDVLVTDYSSIAYDFSLLGRPIAFLAPDLAVYTASRGVYEPYEVFSGGTETASWTELLDLLEGATGNPAVLESLAAHATAIAERHHPFRDGGNTARVYAEITRRLKEHPLTVIPPAGAALPGAALASTALPGVAEPAALPADTALASLDLESGSAELAVVGQVSTGVPTSVQLVGPRMRIPGTVSGPGLDGTWRATVPLVVSRWLGPRLPAPSGTYRLETLDAAGMPITVTAVAGSHLVDDLFTIDFAAPDAAGSPLTITLAAPLTPAERGRENQSRLESAYRSTDFEPIDAVFFESFYGQNASCNPLALDRAIAARLPHVERYWSVVDASVEVPEGSVALIEGSEEWWRIRGSARLLIVNDWLRKRYRRRRHQKVLQTWHGTPLKKIALSRPRNGLRPALATLRERARWDILLAQNPHTARIMRSAYAWLGPTWQEGYPRDDVLAGAHAGDAAADAAAAVRERLGIPAGVTVLLYAPTWRDDRPGHVDHLDVAAFTDELGDGYLTLIRGHSRSLKPGEDVRGSNVLDVTGYPDVSELFLVADALITDYSSVMFDFSVTGKPLFFFAPDLDHYREQLRGFYFDLDAAAPGPLVQEAHELVELVRERHAVAERYADRYAAWRERFNPRDDGGAAARIVERLVRSGILPA